MSLPARCETEIPEWLARTRREAMERFLFDGTYASLFEDDWKYYYQKGYRCVRVRVEEA